VFVSDDAPMFGTSPISGGSVDLIIGYHQTTAEKSERLSLIEGAFLHIGNVNISSSHLGSLQLCVDGNRIHQCFDENLAPIRSMILGTCDEGPYSFCAWIGNVPHNLIASDGMTRFKIESSYSFIDILSPAPSPSTCSFTGSTLLKQIQGSASGFATAISIGISVSDQFCDSIILVMESVSSSARDIHQAGGGNTTRTILVSIGAFVLLIVVGSAMIVVFRRQTALVTGSKTPPSNSPDGNIISQGTGNSPIKLTSERGQLSTQATGNSPEPETGINDQVTVCGPFLMEGNELWDVETPSESLHGERYDQE
jgi:hypothetical protein